jgi:hypothetical protein
MFIINDVSLGGNKLCFTVNCMLSLLSTDSFLSQYGVPQAVNTINFQINQSDVIVLT